MKDMSGSADRAANYPAFDTARNDAAVPQEQGAAASPASRPDPAASAPSSITGGGIVGAIGRIVHLRLLFLIVLLGGPLLAFCILAGR